jgi:large subunit ribosomal protein L3
MIAGLLGRKVGQTQIWDAKEVARPATVLEVGPCVVLQVKTQETDGYSALQIGFDDKPFRRKHGKGEARKPNERRGATKPELGHARKAETTPKRFVREIRVASTAEFKPGQSLAVDLLADVARVDVIGVSKGKGFQGTIKLHHFSRGPASHGSMNVRQPGSIGASAAPSRVLPGKRMAGHMGADRHTAANLQVIQADAQRNLLIVHGAVPGAIGGYVIVRPCARMAAGVKAGHAHRPLSLLKAKVQA